MLRAFPMILLAVLAYNALALVGGAAFQPAPVMLAQKFTVPLFSGDAWAISLGDVLIAFTLVLLFIETVRATRTSHREIINHALSMLTFTGALAEFLVLKGFGTSTFFLITAMCLFDVVAGYTIAIISARRDLSVVRDEEHYDDRQGH
jgi:hypothetical protein